MLTRDEEFITSDLGATSLQFAGTVGYRKDSAPVERLVAPARLAQWFVYEGLLSEAPPVSPDELTAAIVLREAIYRTVNAAMRAEPLPERDVATINSFADDEPPRTVLRADGTATRTATAPVHAALAAVARDAIDVVTRHASELHACEGDRCSGIFIDTSRGRRRRWCSMARCGNRAKVWAFRNRASKR
jgi:predicted RNA-binding Zn ribbon-like protein